MLKTCMDAIIFMVSFRFLSPNDKRLLLRKEKALHSSGGFFYALFSCEGGDPDPSREQKRPELIHSFVANATKLIPHGNKKKPSRRWHLHLESLLPHRGHSFIYEIIQQ